MQRGSERPIRGRDDELRQLDALLANAAEGFAGVAVITAPPGLGKTTLVEHLARQAESIGTTVLTGRATEWAAGRSLAPFLDAIPPRDPAGETIDEARKADDAVAQPDAPGGSRYAATGHVLDDLDSIVAEGPAALVLEDLHWADDDTLWLLERLVGQVDGLPLTIFVTRRPAPRSPVLDRIEERRNVESIELRPLEPELLLAIASDVLGRTPDAATAAALQDAGGSPLLAMLLAELASRDGTAPRHASLDLMVRQMGSLRPETSELVSAASILGSRFQLDDLATLVDRSAFALLAPLDEAAGVGLLRTDEDGIAFRHELVWRAVYDDIPEPVRLSLHRDFAHRIARRDGSHERAISHLAIGSRPGDRGDIDQLQRAAEQVAARDPTTAAGLYERALDLSEGADPRQIELSVGLVKALLWSGQFYRARTRAERLLETPLDPVTEAELRRARARILVYQGRVEEALAETERALERELPPSQRARLLADASLRRLVCADPGGAAAAADEALRLAAEADDSVARTLARCARSRVDGDGGDVRSALANAQAALDDRDGVPREAIEVLQPRLYLGLALLDADRLVDAEAAFVEGRRMAEELGSAWMVPLFHLGSTVEAYLTGDWDRALVEAETGLRAAEELNSSVWSPWTHAVAALIELARSPAEAASHLAAIDEHLRANGESQFGGPWLTLARMRSLEVNGQVEAALAHGLEQWHRVGPGHVGERRLYGVELVRLLGVAGDETSARDIASVLTLAAERSRAPADASAVLHASGLLTGEPASILAAAEAYAGASRPAYAARALEDAARLWLAEADQARNLAARAVAVYERLGAGFEAARVESLLRSLGVRRGVRSTRRRARTGWDSITDTELQVLRLVADGRTNRQIAAQMYLSPRTIETHVSHLFGKLEVSSRAELAARYAERRATESGESPMSRQEPA